MSARRQSAPADRRARLHDLVAYAVERSPYYRETIGAAGTGERLDLELLPTLPKATLMREFDRIVTRPELRLSDLEAHLGGPDAGLPYLGGYRVFASSGSSGLRGVFVQSEEEFARWVAVHRPVLGRLGICPSTRLAAIGAPSPIHLSKQLFAALGSGGARPLRLSVLTPMPELCAALGAFQPDALLGYSSIVAALAEQQLMGGLDIAPRVVATGAEILTSELEQRIADAWAIRPGRIYATTEAPIIAASDPGHSALRVLDDVVWIEVVDEHGRHVPPGTPGHRVLVTNLVNRVQPLIRYELTDSVTVTGSGEIASIDGRSDDILLLPATGGGGTKPVHPLRLRAPFAHLAEVVLYQLVQEGEELRVRVVPRSDAAPDLAARVHRALAAALAEAGVQPVMRIELVDSIERDGHAAKLKLITRGEPQPAILMRSFRA